MSNVTLAATLHDPADRQLQQALRVLPHLRAAYTSIVVLASDTTGTATTTALSSAGITLLQRQEAGDLASLGAVRRDLVQRAHSARPESHIHLCDWDRIIHWAEQWPAELDNTVATLPTVDFLILGRTPRAFASHPRVQRDTESLINAAFEYAWGQPLDICAASRGLSPRAARLLIAGCDEESIGNDGAWPLFMARDPTLRISYLATEGLDWETPDRYSAEIARAGNLDAWIAAFDADLANWEFRAHLALVEIQAIRRWHRPAPSGDATPPSPPHAR
ncbi:MAG: hypothetical protein NVS2B7_24250 [Herpetosiphon sp.]